MNTLSAPGWAPHPDATATTAGGANLGAAALPMPGAVAPLAMLVCALVLALALLSYFVQVLNEHVHRGEQLRQAHRHAAASKSVTEPRRPPSQRSAQVRTASR